MRFLHLPALLLASAAALAQPITVTPGSAPFYPAAPTSGCSFSYGLAGAGTSTCQINVSSVASSGSPGPGGASNYQFNLRGDATAQFKDLNTTSFSGYFTQAWSLTTGASPVKLSGINLDWNGKQVPSGGNAATFNNQAFANAQLSVPGFGLDIGKYLQTPTFVAQGVHYINQNSGIDETILAAQTTYQLILNSVAFVIVDNYPATSSMLGYAYELGGTVSPGFTGVTLGFLATPVPEPAPALLFAAGLALFAARRRLAGAAPAVAG